jgi:hypothetical protein
MIHEVLAFDAAQSAPDPMPDAQDWKAVAGWL